MLEVGDGVVLIQPTTPASGGLQEYGRPGEALARLADTQIRSSLSRLGGLLTLVRSSVADACKDADEVTFEFSIGFSGEGDLYILRGKAEAVAKVTVTWSSKES